MKLSWIEHPAALTYLQLLAAIATACDGAPSTSSPATPSTATAAGTSGSSVAGGGGNAAHSSNAGAGGLAAAGAGAGGTASAGVRHVTVRFQPELLGQPFACGKTYPDVGASHISVEPADFRFFVQDLRLIDGAGKEVPVTMDERTPWQTHAVALLDFEDQTGACSQGNPETNNQITGTVPEGTYSGVVFSNGVPEQLNHEDPLQHPAPLQFTDLTWGWLGGFKFFVSELHAVGTYDADAGIDTGAGLLHIGSRNCNGDRNVAITCMEPNRNEVRLLDFDPDTNMIAADIGRVFANTDLRMDAQCHSAGDYCAPMFEQVGVDWTTGKSMTTQQIYTVK